MNTLRAVCTLSFGSDHGMGANSCVVKKILFAVMFIGETRAINTTLTDNIHIFFASSVKGQIFMLLRF